MNKSILNLLNIFIYESNSIRSKIILKSYFLVQCIKICVIFYSSFYVTNLCHKYNLAFIFIIYITSAFSTVKYIQVRQKNKGIMQCYSYGQLRKSKQNYTV